MFLRKFAYLSKSLLLLLSIINASAQTFIHAGILHSNEDLQRMKEALRTSKNPFTHAISFSFKILHGNSLIKYKGHWQWWEGMKIQAQESGRNQAHTQLGIGMLVECSAIAWKQGLNLYAN